MIRLDTELVERIVVVLIFITLSLIYLTKPKEIIKEDFIVNEDSFNIFPLIAWKDTHEKWNGDDGDIVKIRYRVNSSNTKLCIYHVNSNRLVHEQPFTRDPWPDGRYRDFTYVWKLYKTERTIDIPAGEYEIVVGGAYEGGFGQLKTTIKI